MSNLFKLLHCSEYRRELYFHGNLLPNNTLPLLYFRDGGLFTKFAHVMHINISREAVKVDYDNNNRVYRYRIKI